MTRVGEYISNRFAKESDKIEGERLKEGHSNIVKLVAEGGIESLKEILTFHSILFKGDPWAGHWRRVDVQVGGYLAPYWAQVPELMAQFWLQFHEMDSWEAHNAFQKIHPFQDGNGRMGRLIWLSKAVKEGYNFSIPFLHKYYYQTLNKMSGDRK